MSKRLRLDKSFVYKRFKKDLTAKYGEKKALDIWNAAQRYNIIIESPEVR